MPVDRGQAGEASRHDGKPKMTATVPGACMSDVAAGIVDQIQPFRRQRSEPVADVAGEIRAQDGSFSWMCRAR
jgi:hypothetical protein